ncbi:MAG TPA: hypothetical protein VFO62_11135 [Candidatus Binatia bacterium]|nr:hypothetical protein [Candidatus Binatia bacterium]
MGYQKAVGEFTFKFRKAELFVAKGDFVSLPDDLANQGIEQGALIEVPFEAVLAAAKSASAGASTLEAGEPARAPRRRYNRSTELED